MRLTALAGLFNTFRLTFEDVRPQHALFDRAVATNRWSISSKVLRDFIEHFGQGTEQLDICSEQGRMNFTSFTQKIVSGDSESASRRMTVLTLASRA
jgi:cell cycle checkpoint control protein RAD9A